MAVLASGGTPRQLEFPLVPCDPGAWFPMPVRKDDRNGDALLEWIEDSDIDARFVPDWSDESFQNAA